MTRRTLKGNAMSAVKSNVITMRRSSSDVVITQKELDNLNTLQHALTFAAQNYARRSARVANALRSGAEIEPGPLTFHRELKAAVSAVSLANK